MHLHQVLTGAVNPGDNCYSVGSVEDIPFTVMVATARGERGRPGGGGGRGGCFVGPRSAVGGAGGD